MGIPIDKRYCRFAQRSVHVAMTIMLVFKQTTSPTKLLGGPGSSHGRILRWAAPVHAELAKIALVLLGCKPQTASVERLFKEYSRSLKNIAGQLLHHSDKSAFTGSQRPCQSGASVGVRGF